jgi:NAD(P)H-dependent FMN reductase
MNLIISASGREGSRTQQISTLYQQLLEGKGVSSRLFSLRGVDVLHRDSAFIKIEEEIIAPAQRIFFIVPEYNGSFPGILKCFIDTVKNHLIWSHKTALLTGVSTGRAGNLRGMDHLTGILHYLQVTVYPSALPISGVGKLLNERGELTDENTLKAIHQQLDGFLEWSRQHSPFNKSH